MLQCKLVSANARLPSRGCVNSVGLDLHSAETVFINPMQVEVISTDLIIKPPNGTYGHITARSGFTMKHKVIILTGIIEAGYRGVVKVMMMNIDDKTFVVNPGDRIAQIICEKICAPKVCLCIGTMDSTS